MESRLALPLLSLLLCSIAVPAALLDASHQPARAQVLAIETTVADALKSNVETFASPTEQPGAREALAAFYQARAFAPVWVDNRGPTRAATLVLAELAKAADYGLDESAFAPVATAAPRTGGVWTNVQAAAAEFEISTLVLKYANQARGGRIYAPEELLSSYLDRQPDLPDPVAVLNDVSASATPDALLRSYQPQQEQFQFLQAAYQSLRAKQAGSEDIALATDGPLLKEGVRHRNVLVLRKRFELSETGEAADLFDAALSAAVRAFQKTSGLAADGIVGRRTRQALAGQSEAGQLERLRANLEAWRWMPADLGAEHLFVNIPSFSIQVVKNGSVALTERVITGQTSKQTPVFSKELSTIVLRPQWHLPDSIKIEKLISAQRRGRRLEDMGYVIRKGRRTVKSWEIDWATAKLSHYEISQPSGDDNALGDVKFLFPNKHSVYLHDTPSKSLFAASERTFSHGCIRLRNPLSLAQMLLDDDKGVGAFDVKRLVRRGPGSNQIELEHALPIHVAYFTAWADHDGNVTYYKDVYGHERRIKLALAGNWKKINKGRDHLAAINAAEQLKAISALPPGLPPPAAGGLFASFGQPMGVTSGPPTLFKPAKGYSRSKNSVGDMMQRALGGGF